MQKLFAATIAIAGFGFGATHDTTTTIGTISPEPAVAGQPYSVAYTITSPAGTPPGNVEVSDGSTVATCNVEDGTCSLTSASPGIKTITVTYLGKATFTGSNATTTHSVYGAQPISVAPSSGSLGRQRFSFLARDAQGAGSIQYTQFLVSKSGINAVNACYISYDPVGNVFYLLSDDTTQWYGLLAGSANTIGNAECTIYGPTSGGAAVGTDLTTTVDISFRSGFSGLKNVYQFAGDTFGNGSGWQSMGTWNDAGDPNVVELTSLTPNSGTGSAQVFTAVVRDGNGGSTIPAVQFLINGTLNAVNGCYIYYDATGNVFYLVDDTATTFSGVVAGSPGQVNNSQCTLSGIGSGGTVSGTDLTITYNLSFSGGFTGTNQIYMQTVDNIGTNEVWHTIGTWIP